MKQYLFVYSEFMKYTVLADSFSEAKRLEDKNPKKYYRPYGKRNIEYLEYKEVYRIQKNEKLRVY